MSANKYDATYRTITCVIPIIFNVQGFVVIYCYRSDHSCWILLGEHIYVFENFTVFKNSCIQDEYLEICVLISNRKSKF